MFTGLISTLREMGDNMNRRTLTICPTRGRSKLCKEMVQSFHDTIETDNTIVLGINIDEIEIIAYQEIQPANKILCKADSTVTSIINSIYQAHPDYDFYHITNDDVIYRTKGWDSKFLHLAEEYGHGIFYGNDLFQGKNLCAHPFISTELIQALGWLQMPTLNRYAGDVVWKFIGESCNCLYYLDGVIIQHNWKGCVSPSTNESDMVEFAKWLPWSFKDVKKVKESLNAKNRI